MEKYADVLTVEGLLIILLLVDTCVLCLSVCHHRGYGRQLLHTQGVWGDQPWPWWS